MSGLTSVPRGAAPQLTEGERSASRGTPDMVAIGKAGMKTRLERAAVRRGLITGTINLQELLTNPPPEIDALTILDVLRMLRAHRCQNRWEHALGQAALKDNVNLLVRIDRASIPTKFWAVEHGQRHARLLRRAA